MTHEGDDFLEEFDHPYYDDDLDLFYDDPPEEPGMLDHILDALPSWSDMFNNGPEGEPPTKDDGPMSVAPDQGADQVATLQNNGLKLG